MTKQRYEKVEHFSVIMKISTIDSISVFVLVIHKVQHRRHDTVYTEKTNRAISAEVTLFQLKRSIGARFISFRLLTRAAASRKRPLKTDSDPSLTKSGGVPFA